MTELLLASITNPVFMVFVGFLCHFMKTLVDLADQGKPSTALKYIKQNPYRIAISLLGSIVGIAIMSEMGELTTLNALLVGYSGNSLIQTLTAKASSKFGARKE